MRDSQSISDRDAPPTATSKSAHPQAHHKRQSDNHLKLRDQRCDSADRAAFLQARPGEFGATRADPRPPALFCCQANGELLRQDSPAPPRVELTNKMSRSTLSPLLRGSQKGVSQARLAVAEALMEFHHCLDLPSTTKEHRHSHSGLSLMRK